MDAEEYILILRSKIFNAALFLVGLSFVLLLGRFVISIWFPFLSNSVGFAFSLCQFITACMAGGYVILVYRIRKDYLETEALND